MTTTQDGGKFVSLAHQPPLPSGNVSDTHFCLRLYCDRKEFMSMKNSNGTNWDGTSDLAICSAAG